MEKFPSQQPQKSASPEKTKEASERPIEIRDLSMHVRYLIDRTRKDVLGATDEKDRERKGKTEEKFVGIAQMIGTQLLNNVHSPEELIASLNQYETTATQDLNTAEARKDASEIKRIEKVLQQIEETKDFVERFSPSELRQKPFLEWQSAQGAKSVEKKSEAQKVERAKNDQEIKETELMLKIMADGSIGLYTSLPEKYSHDGKHGGFGGLLDNRRSRKGERDYSVFAKHALQFSGLDDRGERHKYGAAHVREFVTLVPAEEDVYKETDVPVQEKRFGGLFGAKTIVEKKKIKVGVRPILHSEAVANGKEEPLFRLWYCVQNNTEDNTDDYGLSYRDHSGRPGNMLSIEVLLPQSEALKIMQEIKSNPAFIRKVAEETILKKLGIPEKAWREGDEATVYPLRPPYEKWDADSGGKIYIKESGDEYGFNSERIVKLKR